MSINIGFNEVMPVETLRKNYDLYDISPEKLHKALAWYRLGANWQLKRHNILTGPNLRIGDTSDNQHDRSGLTLFSDGKMDVLLQISDLDCLRHMGWGSKLRADYGADVPIKPLLTHKQWFEAFGVEEITHWLEYMDVPGMAPFPGENSWVQNNVGVTGLAYLQQPHEYEALLECGIYFIETYAKNPYAKLQTFVANSLNRR